MYWPLDFGFPDYVWDYEWSDQFTDEEYEYKDAA